MSALQGSQLSSPLLKAKKDLRWFEGRKSGIYCQLHIENKARTMVLILFLFNILSEKSHIWTCGGSICGCTYASTGLPASRMTGRMAVQGSLFKKQKNNYTPSQTVIISFIPFQSPKCLKVLVSPSMAEGWDCDTASRCFCEGPSDLILFSNQRQRSK